MSFWEKAWGRFVAFAVVVGAVASIVKILDWFGVKPPGIHMADFCTSNSVVMLCMLLTWGTVAFDMYGRRKQGQPGVSVDPDGLRSQWKNYLLTEVRGKEFRREPVKLDGCKFHSCSFEDVTFEYQGTAPFEMINPKITAPRLGKRIVLLKTSHPIVNRTHHFLDVLYIQTDRSH